MPATETQQKQFPNYFKNFVLPKEAKEENIRVYRACKTGNCDKISFTPTYEEKLSEEPDYVPQSPADPSEYSLSVYEKFKDIKRFAKLDSAIRKPFKIAIGNTSPKHGLVQRTRERNCKDKKSKKNNSHVDWWIYENATPHEEFKIIDDLERHQSEIG